MSVCLIFVQGPAQCLVGRLDSDVPDHRDTHVRVRLEAERHDRHHDEKHRNHANYLKKNITKCNWNTYKTITVFADANSFGPSKTILMEKRSMTGSRISQPIKEGESSGL